MGFRALAWRSLAGSLCIAAAVAIFALLSGSFDDTDWRLIATSVAFGIFSSTAAAGASVRLRDAAWARALGVATLAASGLAFLLLVAALWIDDGDGEGLWRAWGVAALVALWTSHAAILLRAAAPGDSPAIRALTGTAVVSLGIDTTAGVLAVLGIGDAAEATVQALAVVAVIAVLSTALLPILRRLRATGAASPAIQPASLSAEIAAAAARLDALAATPELRTEVARLRELARAARSADRPR